MATAWVPTSGEAATRSTPASGLSVQQLLIRLGPLFWTDWFLSLFIVPGLFLPGVDLISACDIRYCTQDAFFQIKVRHFLSSCYCVSGEHYDFFFLSL